MRKPRAAVFRREMATLHLWTAGRLPGFPTIHTKGLLLRVSLVLVALLHFAQAKQLIICKTAGTASWHAHKHHSRVGASHFWGR